MGCVTLITSPECWVTEIDIGVQKIPLKLETGAWEFQHLMQAQTKIL